MPYLLPEGSELLQDLGFLGFRLSGVLITQPHKKPRGKQLTQEQKDENALIAHRRVRIEHIICSIKRCRIVKDTIRLWKDSVRDMVMAICCGLHNFRLGSVIQFSRRPSILMGGFAAHEREQDVDDCPAQTPG
jgi:hypothetical protein